MAETEYPKFDKNCCLKIDIDAIADFGKVLKIVSRRFHVFKKFGLAYKTAFVFSTTKGHHIYIEFENDDKWNALDFRDKVFMQLVFGSDFNREVFNWLRAKDNVDWNILFIRKYDEQGNLVSTEKYSEENSRRFNYEHQQFLVTAKWLKK